MRKFVSVAAPALAVILGVAAIAWHPTEHGPVPLAFDGAGAGSGEPSAPPPGKEAGALTNPLLDAPNKEAARSSATATAEARRLLGVVSEWIHNRTPGAPHIVIRQIADLLDRQPECAGIFLDALKHASEPYRTILGLAFGMVNDLSLRKHLLEKWRATAPKDTKEQKILADAEKTVAAITGGATREEKLRLIEHIPASTLKDPRVLSAFEQLADSSTDPTLRRRAIHRLARYDAPAARRFAVGILEDQNRDDRDRAMAAMGLSSSDAPDLEDVFLGILDGEDATPVRVFAAAGLATFVAHPRVQDTLLRLIENSDNPACLQKQAALALARGLVHVPAVKQANVLSRVRTVLEKIARQDDPHGVLVEILGDFADCLGKKFFPEVRAIASLVTDGNLRQRLKDAIPLRSAWEGR